VSPPPLQIPESTGTPIRMTAPHTSAALHDLPHTLTLSPSPGTPKFVRRHSISGPISPGRCFSPSFKPWKIPPSMSPMALSRPATSNKHSVTPIRLDASPIARTSSMTTTPSSSSLSGPGRRFTPLMSPKSPYRISMRSPASSSTPKKFVLDGFASLPPGFAQIPKSPRSLKKEHRDPAAILDASATTTATTTTNTADVSSSPTPFSFPSPSTVGTASFQQQLKGEKGQRSPIKSETTPFLFNSLLSSPSPSSVSFKEDPEVCELPIDSNTSVGIDLVEVVAPHIRLGPDFQCSVPDASSITALSSVYPSDPNEDDPREGTRVEYVPSTELTETERDRSSMWSIRKQLMALGRQVPTHINPSQPQSPRLTCVHTTVYPPWPEVDRDSNEAVFQSKVRELRAKRSFESVVWFSRRAVKPEADSLSPVGNRNPKRVQPASSVLVGSPARFTATNGVERESGKDAQTDGVSEVEKTISTKQRKRKKVLVEEEEEPPMYRLLFPPISLPGPASLVRRSGRTRKMTKRALMAEGPSTTSVPSRSNGSEGTVTSTSPSSSDTASVDSSEKRKAKANARGTSAKPTKKMKAVEEEGVDVKPKRGRKLSKKKKKTKKTGREGKGEEGEEGGEEGEGEREAVTAVVAEQQHILKHVMLYRLSSKHLCKKCQMLA